MGDTTAISWADHTFNPWEGCTRLSPACDNCYAADRAHRFGNDQLWSGDRRRTSLANWKKPLAWNRAAAAAGAPAHVFCASLADVFDNQAPQEWREDLWHLIEATPHLVWMLLTKRPQNVAKMLPSRWRPFIDATGTHVPAPRNIILGTTAEDQQRADQRIAITASLAGNLGWRWFLSAEPLLGSVDLTCVEIPGTQPGRFNALTGNAKYAALHDSPAGAILGRLTFPPPALVIAGGESGRNARPSHPDWFRRLRNDCTGAGVPFHFKQWGEWIEGDMIVTAMSNQVVTVGRTAQIAWPDGTITADGYGRDHGGPGNWMRRRDTARNGRQLDGVEHLALPS